MKLSDFMYDLPEERIAQTPIEPRDHSRLFYQAFAAIFGASLKKEYHPEDEDQMIERIVQLVENGQL